jgi:hypothetical protein
VTGDTVIGVGLAVLGIGAPLTVAVMKHFSLKKLALPPGHAEECILHHREMAYLQVQIKGLSDNVIFVRESVNRIEGELAKVREKLDK